MMPIDHNKVAAVCQMLESGPCRPALAWRVFGFCAFELNPEVAQLQAGKAAAEVVRDLASRLEEQCVQLGAVDQARGAQVLHQQAEQLAVSVGLERGVLLQGVEGARSYV